MRYKLAISAPLLPIKKPRTWTSSVFGHDPYSINKLSQFLHH